MMLALACASSSNTAEAIVVGSVLGIIAVVGTICLTFLIYKGKI